MVKTTTIQGIFSASCEVFNVKKLLNDIAFYSFVTVLTAVGVFVIIVIAWAGSSIITAAVYNIGTVLAYAGIMLFCACIYPYSFRQRRYRKERKQ